MRPQSLKHNPEKYKGIYCHYPNPHNRKSKQWKSAVAAKKSAVCIISFVTTQAVKGRGGKHILTQFLRNKMSLQKEQAHMILRVGQEEGLDLFIPVLLTWSSSFSYR